MSGKAWSVLALILVVAACGKKPDVEPRTAPAQQRSLVVLLEQPNGSEASSEVLLHVRRELRAAGLEVISRPALLDGDLELLSQTSARELRPAAVIFAVERPAEGNEPRRIELWLSDRLYRRTFVQSLPLDSEDAGRVYRRLAEQAVELLKGRVFAWRLAQTDAPVATF